MTDTTPTTAAAEGTTPAPIPTSPSELAEQTLRARFPQAVLNSSTYRGTTTLVVRSQDLVNVARTLRDDPNLRFVMLENITGVDWSKHRGYPNLPHGKERFTGIYQFFAPTTGTRLTLKAPAPGGDSPVLPSLTSLWAGADWPEREAYDLLGIKYEGHPDLRRILLPNNWPNHPLRKEVPRGGEPVPFSMTWEDEEFEHFGKQIIEARAVPQVPPKQADANKHMILSLGPHHPSTHGVLRVVLELDGETVVRAYPDIGYLHSGFEKQGETIRYKDFLPYTDRSDYVSSMLNNLGYSLAVETLMGVDIPERAQVIRVIMGELQRIASHLLWLGTAVMDAAGVSHALLMYAFREREKILDLFELVSGARLTTSYIRPGGVWKDVPPSFVARATEFVGQFPKQLDDFERMVTGSPVWKIRNDGVGKLTQEQALSLMLTGPLLRGSGIAHDWRKARPYSGYENYDFKVPTQTDGDGYARYLVRIEEMRQCVSIIKQGLRNLPDGPVWTADRKMALPPRQELDVSMEAVIHHFKLMTEGFTPPRGEVYECVESPRGEEGFYLVSDGSAIPYRLRFRTPSFHNLQALNTMSMGRLLADLVINIGSIDIVLGDVDR